MSEVKVRRRRQKDVNDSIVESQGLSEDSVREVLNESGRRTLVKVSGFLATGCTLLDLAIAGKYPGGVPVGRYTHIFGSESTCKTVLGMLILGAAQRNGCLAFFCDVEDTFDEDWARLFGLDCSTDTWRLNKISADGNVCVPNSIEKLFDSYLSGICELDDNRPKIVVIDTLSALPSEKEIKTAMVDSGFAMTRAKQVSLGMRKYQRPLAESNTGVVLLDQTRDDPSVTFGDRETVSGGRAPKFYSSVRIHLFPGSKVKNKAGVEIGTWIRFRIDKNKVAPPYRSGEFKILWEYGLDDIGSNLQFLKSIQDLIAKEEGGRTRKSATVEFNGKSKTISKMITYVEENNLEDELIAEVVDLWHEIHKPEPRKPRVWQS